MLSDIEEGTASTGFAFRVLEAQRFRNLQGSRACVSGFWVWRYLASGICGDVLGPGCFCRVKVLECREEAGALGLVGLGITVLRQ